MSFSGYIQQNLFDEGCSFERVAFVILDIPTQALDEAYAYAAPSDMRHLKVGCAVRVPFGGRQAVGFVTKIVEAQDSGLDMRTYSKLKAVMEVLSHPYFDEVGAELAQYLATKYVAPLSSCIRSFTPPGGVPKVVLRDGEWTVVRQQVDQVDDRWVSLTPAAKDYKPRANAVKQISVLEALSRGELRMAELTMEFGSVSSVVNGLEKKGIVKVESRRRFRGVDGQALPKENEGEELQKRFAAPAGLHLTEGQAEALRVIEDAGTRGGEVVLIDGVTGSGKTEVYLQAISKVLAEGKNALVLVPEISLTPQTVGRFRGRFGNLVAVMHSRMSQGERYDQWDFVRSGGARVVVGARSALFTPLANIGMIVIDEEHESSYKQDSAPRYVSKDVALWLAKRHGATLVLGSATPSIESLHSCESDPTWHHVLLAERANKQPLPEVTIVDMAKEFGAKHRSMFSRRLTNELRTTLSAGQKAILLLNQRGFAKFLLCRDCGHVPECPSCSTSLTFHEEGNLLMCHHCGYARKAPAVCPECGSPYLRKFGAGTQRVEDELRALVATFDGVDARVIRMDADTTKTKGAHRKLLEEFMLPGPAVLLGTQMIAKGLDFEDVTLVGVINADTMLKVPDFRSAERTFALVEQVAGRAGRAHLKGQVIVQTYWADAVAIKAASAYNRDVFLEDELAKRKMLKYPPFVHLANVLIWGREQDAVEQVAREVFAGICEAIGPENLGRWMPLAPTACYPERLKGNYRWHIVVKAPLDADVSAVLGPYFKSRKPTEDVRVAVDIDPASLM